MIKEGDKLPELEIETDCKGKLKLSDYLGKNLVIYFYPKDKTPGCTLEAITFSGLYQKFAEQNCEIIGISRDSIESHQKFKDMFNLEHVLAMSASTQFYEAFGVLTEKSMFGTKYIGIERSTFLIDTKGILRKAWRKVKVFGHADKVYNELLKINS